MGKLTNLNPSKPLTEADMPPGMATDTETSTAIAAHVAATDPHTQYLLPSEGDARYRQSSVALTDSDIPAGIARDTETSTAIAAHVAATDPHTQYLLPSEGDARYRQSSVALSDSDIPAGIARDAELTAAQSAHLAATDPHTQYATQARGDARYFRGRTQTYTLDPPSMGAGELYKIFFSFVGAKVGDFALVTPINANLYALAMWPFVFSAVIENVDTVAVYLRNDNNAAIDLSPFTLRVMVVNV